MVGASTIPSPQVGQQPRTGPFSGLCNRMLQVKRRNVGEITRGVFGVSRRSTLLIKQGFTTPQRGVCPRAVQGEKVRYVAFRWRGGDGRAGICDGERSEGCRRGTLLRGPYITFHRFPQSTSESQGGGYWKKRSTLGNRESASEKRRS